MSGDVEPTLAFLLAFDGRVHHDTGGYLVKFEIRQVEPTKERPHGLRYAFTLHGPTGRRILGFDNAHAVAPLGSKYNSKPVVTDHWHRTEDDPGRPYSFESAERLVDDFFDEVERVLGAHGISLDVVDVEDRSEK